MKFDWVDKCRYLGVFFISGRQFRCSFDNAKCKLFTSFNSIFSKVGRFASEEVVINLLRTKCIPCLLYCVEACPFFQHDKHSFDFSLTRIFMKLFHTGSAATVSECQKQFSFLPLKYQVDIRSACFMLRFMATDKSICNLFLSQATRSLDSLYARYGDAVNSISSLKAAVYKEFFDI